MFQTQSGNNKGLLWAKAGVTVVEILIVAFVIGIALSAFSRLISFSLAQGQIVNQTSQAVSLAKEQLEAARNFRDGTVWQNGVAALTTGVAYHVSLSLDVPAKWQMTLGSETIGIFSRSLVFTNGLRNQDGNIVESGGTVDSNTKKIVSQVSWSERGRLHQIELTTYLTNWKQ